MAYGLLTLGLVLVALLLLFLVISRRQRTLNPKLPQQPIRLSPEAQLLKLQNMERFRGIRIESRCRASSHLVGEEFGFDSAPHLPVSGCDAAVCECGYVGLPERRASGERRSGRDRRMSMRLESEDRRSERPRRKDDFNTWAAYSNL